MAEHTYLHVKLLNSCVLLASRVKLSRFYLFFMRVPMLIGKPMKKCSNRLSLP